MINSSDHKIISVKNLTQVNRIKTLVSAIHQKEAPVRIFFDASDVIKIIAGLNSIRGKYGFEIEKFLGEGDSSNGDKKFLVHAFAYNNWLNDIHLLPPHQYEFLAQRERKAESLFPKNAQPHLVQEFEGQVPFYQEIRKASLETSDDIKQFAANINAKAIDIFRVHYMLQDSHWVYRYKRCFKQPQHHFHFVQEADYALTKEAEQHPLYRALRNYFNRESNRTDRRGPNDFDAFALCVLQLHLERYKADPENYPLPFFYSNQKDILNAIEIFSKRSDLDYPFVIPAKIVESPSHKNPFLIVQNSDFFLWHGIYKRANLDENFSKILAYFDKKSRNIILMPEGSRPTSEEKLKESDAELKETVEDQIYLDFINAWWSEEGSQQILNDILDNNPNLNAQKGEDIRKEVLALFQEENQKVKTLMPRLWLKNQCFSELRNLKKIVKRWANSEVDFPVKEEFGIRLSFDNDLCEYIDDTIRILLNTSEENHEFYPTVDDVIEKTIMGTFDISQQKELSIALAIFWFFEKYHLIDIVCKKSREICQKTGSNDVYPNWRIGMLHAGAVLRNEKSADDTTIEDLIQTAKRILECIEEKSSEHYQIWIGLSIFYLYIWQKIVDRTEVYEYYPKDQYQDDKEKLGAPYLQKGIDFAKKSINYLRKPENQKTVAHQRKYYYALNNYIYLTSLTYTKDQFEKLDDDIKNFYRAKEKPINWQIRFHHTLRVYYLRKAKLAGTLDEYMENLDSAISHNTDAIKYELDSDERRKYEDFVKELNKLKRYPPTHLK